jgi:hypothetical protein
MFILSDFRGIMYIDDGLQALVLGIGAQSPVSHNHLQRAHLRLTTY